jgi:hypothetical protein
MTKLRISGQTLSVSQSRFENYILLIAVRLFFQLVMNISLLNDFGHYQILHRHSILVIARSTSLALREVSDESYIVDSVQHIPFLAKHARSRWSTVNATLTDTSITHLAGTQVSRVGPTLPHPFTSPV